MDHKRMMGAKYGGPSDDNTTSKNSKAPLIAGLFSFKRDSMFDDCGSIAFSAFSDYAQNKHIQGE